MRAIAQRIAHESMELNEDEWLELMEFVASKKGVFSMLAIFYETILKFELYIV